jgi:hypothetical protein
MKIGDTLIVVKDFWFNNRSYKIGNKFKIVGDSGQRGWDIEDSKGFIIYESVMISTYFESLIKQRKQKLKQLETLKKIKNEKLFKKISITNI